MKALKQQLSKESVAGVLFTLPFTIGFLLFMICLLYTSDAADE